MDSLATTRTTPVSWGETLGGRPTLDVHVGGAVPAHVRRWRDIPPAIDQSSLDQHYLSVHLGGSKRLHRTGDGHRQTRDTQVAAHSIVPAGAAFRWLTEGPVDFMHLYFDPKTIDHFVADSFDRDPRSARLRECLGESQQLIDTIAASVLAEVTSDNGVQQAYLDDLMHLLLFQVLRCYSDAASVPTLNQHTLAPHRLRLAIEFIESQLAQSIGVADIAAAAGMSAFHFSRAFRTTTGAPPYAYLLDRRIAAAKRRLAEPGLPLATVAHECGFNNASQFSRMFKAATGRTPSDYRRRL